MPRLSARFYYWSSERQQQQPRSTGVSSPTESKKNWILRGSGFALDFIWTTTFAHVPDLLSSCRWSHKKSPHATQKRLRSVFASSSDGRLDTQLVSRYRVVLIKSPGPASQLISRGNHAITSRPLIVRHQLVFGPHEGGGGSNESMEFLVSQSSFSL